jgi:hypothetical protein
MQKLKKKKKPHQFFVHSDKYLAEDARFYESLKTKRSSNHFDFAFNLYKRFKRWSKDTKMSSIDAYLVELFDKVKNLPFKKESMKLDYYTAEKFPDLIKPLQRKISFWCYREIANSGLKKYQMRRIRLWAEKTTEASKTGKIGPEKIRAKIETIYKKTRKHKTTVIYHTFENSLKQIKEFLEKHKDTIILQSAINIQIIPPHREENTTEKV